MEFSAGSALGRFRSAGNLTFADRHSALLAVGVVPGRVLFENSHHGLIAVSADHGCPPEYCAGPSGRQLGSEGRTVIVDQMEADFFGAAVRAFQDD
jgi:hypothetical protein